MNQVWLEAMATLCGENLLLIYAYLLFMPFILFLLP